MTELFKN
jgi:hypothetical protein